MPESFVKRPQRSESEGEAWRTIRTCSGDLLKAEIALLHSLVRPHMHDVPSAEASAPSQEEMKLLFAELGVCVHLYQRIELLLKVLLPHLVVPGTDTHAPGEGFENWRILLDSKRTLGELVRLLGQRVTSDNAQALEDAWRRLVQERNEVVHHFAEQSFSRLETKAQYRSAALFLKTRREAALPMFAMLDEFCCAFFASVQEQNRAV